VNPNQDDQKSTMADLPRHWEKKEAEASADGFAVHPIHEDDAQWLSLSDCLQTRGDWLGEGRDVKEKEKYDKLQLVRAWQVENPCRFRKYRVTQAQVEKDLDRLRKDHVRIPALVGVELDRATWHLPGSTGELRRDLNETYLMHGTSPEVLLDVISGGLNERYSKSAAFGSGNYLAEDAGKNDQYVTSDVKHDAFPDLHNRIYSPSHCHPNEKIFYILVCRTTMGSFVRTTATVPFSTSTLWSLDNPGEKIFPITTRELGPIPGTTPRILYHGLVVEKSENLRYREFVTFHGDYVYPEYLLAYKRVDSSLPKVSEQTEQVKNVKVPVFIGGATVDNAVVIGGVTGTHAERVNGIYEPVAEVYNGNLLFQKRGMPDVWLRFEAITRFWMVSSTAHKDAKKNLRGWCHCTQKNLHDPKRALAWKVSTGSSFEDQVDVKCVELLSSVVIGGLTRAHAERVNGIYEPVAEVYNGNLLFQKRGMPDVWLRFEAVNRFWMVSSTAEKDAKKDLGWCHCTEENLHDPKRALAWKVLTGSSFEDQVDVKCVALLSSVVIGGVAGTHAG
jgi:hypothetical protein